MSRPSSLIEHVSELTDFAHAHINFPFCETRCAFCCWTPRFGEDLFAYDELKDAYLEGLKREMSKKRQVEGFDAGVDLQVVHFGGGTPSLLDAGELGGLLETLCSAHGQDPDTILQKDLEVRADTLTRDKLRDYKALGINRLSIGYQSFNQKILDRLGRGESVADYFRVQEDIDAVGFDNVSFDLLYGFTFQSFDEFRRDLDTAVRLAPDRIEISPWVPLYGSSLIEEGYDDAGEARKKMYWTAMAHDILEENGYRNYHHKCFARPGKESIMQLVTAFRIPFLSFGAGADYYDSFSRMSNCDIRAYIEAPGAGYDSRLAISDGGWLAQVLVGLPVELMFPDGVLLSRFNRRYGCDIMPHIERAGDRAYREELVEGLGIASEEIRAIVLRRTSILLKLKEWLDDGYLEVADGRLRIPRRARFSTNMWHLYGSRI